MTLTGKTFFLPWEPTLMAFLQARLPAGLISAISQLSLFGEEIMLILILGFLYWGLDKRLGAAVGRPVLIGLCWNPMLKNVFLRCRPYFDHEGVSILRIVEPGADPMDIAAQGYSFPSGHSANAASLFGGLAMNLRKRWMTALAVCLPLAVGFSRVVVGAHYPTDVLAGLALGAFCVFFCRWIERAVQSPAARDGILLLTAAPGLLYCRSADYFTGFGILLGFLIGTALEARYVRFENTRSPVRMILRTLGGAALYFALNTALKLPFPKAFLESGTAAALMVRCLRYAVIGAVDFGLYPMLFRLTGRIGTKKAADAA